jgi:thiol:disulfide interchange protein DsbD
MPCVLPVISLKIFSFVSQAGQEPKRVFRLGLAFVAGVFVFFLGMAAVAIALHSAGKTFFWGMQFADPRLFIGLISLVVIFALSMFGVFEITLGSTAENAIGSAARNEGYTGAFVHGLFTTLLGTSCTAPILGSVLGFISTQSPVVIVLAFLLMAAGMSLPYFLLTWHPKWLRFLPKPGAWMERFKQIMGFVLLAVALWLLGVMGKSRGVEAMTATVYFLAALAFASWIYGIGHRRWWALVLAIGIGLVGGKFFLPEALSKSKTTETAIAANKFGITWEPFSKARVNSARAQNQPVFIDFTAEWCVNCKANEKLVLDTPAVSDALKAKKVVTLRADWTDFDAEIGTYIKKLGRAGVPVYVLYPPGEENPIVFPEILTQKTVTDELDKINPSDLVKAR